MTFLYFQAIRPGSSLANCGRSDRATRQLAEVLRRRLECAPRVSAAGQSRRREATVRSASAMSSGVGGDQVWRVFFEKVRRSVKPAVFRAAADGGEKLSSVFRAPSHVETKIGKSHMGNYISDVH